VNILHNQLHRLDAAEAISKMFDDAKRNAKISGHPELTVEEFAKREFGKSTGFVQQHRQLAECDDELKDIGRERSQAFSAVLLIDRVTDTKLRKKLIRMVTKDQASAPVIQQDINEARPEEEKEPLSEKALQAQEISRFQSLLQELREVEKNISNPGTDEKYWAKQARYILGADKIMQKLKGYAGL